MISAPVAETQRKMAAAVAVVVETLIAVKMDLGPVGQMKKAGYPTVNLAEKT